MKFVFSAQEAALERAFEEIAAAIAEASQGAVEDAAALAVREGRAQIAATGFSQRWQSGLRYRFYPNIGDPRGPAALIYHRIGYAGVFEQGATIHGQPLLWLPIERNLPPGIHRPKQYRGRLKSVNVVGKPPLLFDAFNRLRGPLFVGVPAVEIRKRWSLYAIFARAVERMQQFYQQRLKD